MAVSLLGVVESCLTGVSVSVIMCVVVSDFLLAVL